MTISKAQILSALSGLVFVPLGAFVSAWSAKHLPGLPHFSAGEIAGAMGLGAASALSIALHYLKGLREWEKLEAEGVVKVVGATRPATREYKVPDEVRMAAQPGQQE